MSTPDIIPDKDPAADSSMGAMLRGIINKLLQDVDGMLPATVVSYNRKTNRATVIPSIDMLTTAGTALPRAAYASIPVLALGGGGFAINFPLKAGDTGWIEASDRDVSLWLQNGGRQNAWPNTHRIHSFSDGRFIPDALDKYTIAAGVGDAEMTIQTLDGGTTIALGPNRIYMIAPRIDITSQVHVTGDVIVNSIPFSTHKHTGVASGSSTSAGPVA